MSNEEASKVLEPLEEKLLALLRQRDGWKGRINDDRFELKRSIRSGDELLELCVVVGLVLELGLVAGVSSRVVKVWTHRSGYARSQALCRGAVARLAAALASTMVFDAEDEAKCRILKELNASFEDEDGGEGAARQAIGCSCDGAGCEACER